LKASSKTKSSKPGLSNLWTYVGDKNGFKTFDSL